MIKFKRACTKEPIVSVYNSDDELVGKTKSDLELNDVRLQIREQQLKGYYVKYKGERIRIDHQGNLECWPKGLYDQNEDIMMKLIDWG